MAGAWEVLTFDFSNESAGTAALNLTYTFDKATIFFNFGTAGAVAGEQTYYFDDVKFGAAAPVALTQMDLPVTFDLTTVDYGLVGFGGAEQSTIVTDPTLAGNKVAKVIKTATAELWAGTTVTAAAGLGFASRIPFTVSNTKMNVRVWSPVAGIPVRLKVEEHGDPTHSVETEASVTTASGWQTLEFNFLNQSTGTAAINLSYNYDKLSIFFNFGVAGSGQTYYFDDMKFGAAALGVSSFEASNIRMYPNPTSSVFTIEANDAIQSVALYNVLGQEVLAKNSNSTSVTLDVANLQTGVYVVKTMIGGVTATSRLVKN
jgi:hypothetical protein